MFDRDLFGDLVPPPASSLLAERFIVPPFSVLNARDGDWQERKRRWLALGIRSEIGRGENLRLLSTQATESGLNYYRNQGGGMNSCATASGTAGLSYAVNAWVAEKQNAGEIGGGLSGNSSGTSIFDPVLCEIVYSWFTAPGHAVLDPFAGGSVRGIVASVLGRPYTGVELRPEQIAANEQQRAEICAGLAHTPRWLCGDSAVMPLSADARFDFVFSCPPYGDLEVYSDDPRDLSAMDHAAFLAAYRGIISSCVQRLRDDRFACFVVGDFRCRRGFYRNLTGETVAAFEDAGARFYNEAILVTMVGSLPIRVGRQFETARKLGRTHQTVLVFVKGCPKRAALACMAPPDLDAAYQRRLFTEAAE